MRVDYRYPALAIAKKRSASRAWRNVVWMHGASEIAEVHADDAPEAAAVMMQGEHALKKLRFHEGRFYKNTLRMRFDERLSGLETEMLVSVCRKMAADGDYGAAVYPDMTYDLWALWQTDRVSPRDPRSIPTLYESKTEGLRRYDGGKMDMPEDFDQAAAADAYVSSLIVIDEHICVPVEEPMMQGYRPRKAGRDSSLFHEDASCYLRRFGRPADLPSPYGKNERLQESHDGRYWDAAWQYATLPEAAAMGARCEVLLPEAFEIDHAEPRLDRAARVSVAALRRVMVDMGELGMLAERNSLSAVYHELRRLTAKRREFDGEAIEKALGDFSEVTASYGESLGEPFARPFRGAGITGMIDEALATWGDRPIALDAADGVPAPGLKR